MCRPRSQWKCPRFLVTVQECVEILRSAQNDCSVMAEDLLTIEELGGGILAGADAIWHADAAIPVAC